MRSIAFIDTEVEYGSGRILDIGSIRGDGIVFHCCNSKEQIILRFINAFSSGWKN